MHILVLIMLDFECNLIVVNDRRCVMISSVQSVD